MSDLQPIEIGSFWYCGSLLYEGLSTTDIFAKVLAVGENKVYILRKQDFGYTELPPTSMDRQEFLTYYKRLEQ